MADLAIKLQGTPISTTNPTDGQVLQYIASTGLWTAVSPGASTSFADGAAGAPSITFSAETTTGFYKPSAGVIATATGNVFAVVAGAAGAPSIAFVGELTTGFYKPSAGVIATATSNVFAVQAGTRAAPGFAFSAEVGNGLYRPAAGVLGVSSVAFRVVGTGAVNGEQLDIDSLSENLTLSTSGATTDTAANLLPANSFILAVTARVTTTITTATDWKVGDSVISDRFTSADATMTAGETQVGINMWKADRVTAGQGQIQAAAAKVRVTTTGTPGAGAIRLTSHFIKLGAPTS